MRIPREKEFRIWWSKVVFPPYDELHREERYYESMREISGKAWRASAIKEYKRKEWGVKDKEIELLKQQVDYLQKDNARLFFLLNPKPEV